MKPMVSARRTVFWLLGSQSWPMRFSKVAKSLLAM